MNKHFTQKDYELMCILWHVLWKGPHRWFPPPACLLLVVDGVIARNISHFIVRSMERGYIIDSSTIKPPVAGINIVSSSSLRMLHKKDYHDRAALWWQWR